MIYEYITIQWWLTMIFFYGFILVVVFLFVGLELIFHERVSFVGIPILAMAYLERYRVHSNQSTDDKGYSFK